MKKKLTIEVRGIGFPNKGAELMLAALCDKIKHRFPFANIVIAPVAEYQKRAPYGVFQLAKVIKFGMDFGKFFGLLPKNLRMIFGIVMPSEIDVVIDASGFAYGDQWGAEKARMRLADNIRRFKSDESRKVIMLPQAFGPFNDEELKRAMQEIIEHCDLIFAREERSFDYLSNVKSSPRLHQAPDFTNLHRPASNWQLDTENLQVCFIANAKMMEMKADSQGNDYIEFMAHLVKKAVEHQLKPFMLLHEGSKDEALAKQIVQVAGVDIPFISPTSADDVKQVIGQTKLVISSRFHGLVSGLSQNIPVLATGWSHKYQMLLKDYGVEQHLFDESQDTDRAAEAMLELMTNADSYAAMVNTIKSNGSEQKQLTEGMWQQVYKVLEESAR